jgi:uncharacterized membrane protein YidH (DUF202 family)
MSEHSNKLALQRTKFANQRTYLAYMRTGFAIAVIAGTYKKLWVALFGIIMILGSTIQYVLLNHRIINNEDLNVHMLDYIPLIYVGLSLGTMYLQWKHT